MKTTLTPLLASLCCAGLLAATPETPAPQRTFTWVDPADSTITDIRRLGENMILQVGNNLVGEVNRVLATKKPEAALDELHLKQLQLPAATAGKPRITAVKRTSLKVRNPANLPDSADLAALLSIRLELMDGNNPPKVLMQHVAAEGTTPAEWRVYRPIAIFQQCLVCHGPADSLAPGVKARLILAYPDDKAVDYAAAEWRGVIRVSIMAPAESPAPIKKTNP